MTSCPVNCTFPYHSVVPPTHCPHCGRCLGCGASPPIYPRPWPPYTPPPWRYTPPTWSTATTPAWLKRTTAINSTSQAML